MTNYVQITISVGSEDDREAVLLTGDKLPASGRLSSDRRLVDTLDILKQFLQERRLQRRREFELLGSCLFDYLFVGRVRDRFYQYLADLKSGELLRIVLLFESDHGGHVEDPWEYLHIPDDFYPARSGFVAASNVLVLSRRISLQEEARLNPSGEKLRVFVGIASPSKEDVPRWGEGPKQLVDLDDVKEVAAGLADELRKAGAEVMVDEVLSRDRLSAALADTPESFRPHVVHLVAHGDFEASRGGSLALCDESEPRKAAWTVDSDLAETFSHIPSVVFLHACNSARSEQVRGFRGVAMRLVGRGVPAVVGMNFEIDSGTAKTFALKFYQELAKGTPIDQAVQLGRNEIGGMARATGNFSERAFGCPVAFVQVQGAVLVPDAVAEPEQEQEQAAEPARKPTLLSCPVCARYVHSEAISCLWCNKEGTKTPLAPCPNPDCGQLWSPPLRMCVFCDYVPQAAASPVALQGGPRAPSASAADSTSARPPHPPGHTTVGSSTFGGPHE